MTKELECSICFEPRNFYESSWKCGHKFCKICTKEWDGLCPICRTERNFDPLPMPQTTWKDLLCGFFGRERIIPVRHYTLEYARITPTTYFKKWEKKRCIEEHRIRFDMYEGDVQGTCELCGEKQIFPYMG